MGKRSRFIMVAITVISTTTTLGTLPASAFKTSVKSYAVPVGGTYVVTPLLTVGERVPQTSDSSEDYQMVGIPDGIGAQGIGGGNVAVFLNHELSVWNTGGAGPADDVEVDSEPIVGGDLIRGTFVSRYVLSSTGDVMSGDLAFTEVFQDNAFVGPIATTDNDTPAFGRFCSGFMAGPAEGFTRSIYMTNEESDAIFDGKPGTMSPLGGQSVAIFNGEAHALSRIGHFSKENDVVRPGTGSKTVIFSLEDGAAGVPDSQLYMYVGNKDAASGNVLGRNGLNNGSLFVFVPDDTSKPTETEFQTGSLSGHWVKIPNAKNLSDIKLEAASDAVGALGFFRIEDGAFSPNSDDDFYFVSTGEGPVNTNRLGRVYQLHLNANKPTGPATLEVVVNADRVFDPNTTGTYDTSGAVDAPLSPDNVDASGDFLMIQEDGTSPTRTVMTALGRDGQIWRFDIDADGDLDGTSGVAVAELNPPGWVGTPPPAVSAGRWETSGIIDGSAWWGSDSWLFDVQAHAPSLVPLDGSGNPLNVEEDGQLLLMTPS